MTGEEVTCPSCEECGWFTLHEVPAGDVTPATVHARCQSCGHEIVLRRYAALWPEPGESWLDDLARASEQAAEAKFGKTGGLTP